MPRGLPRRFFTLSGIVQQGVPGQGTLGSDAPPLQVPVAALPVVAQNSRVERVVIRWPGGHSVQVVNALALDMVHIIKES